MAAIEVYADILFLVNFSMDFLTLYLTGRLSGKRLGRRRVTAAAAVGGAAGTAMLVGGAEILLTLPAGLLLSVLMSRIAFGPYRSIVRLLRDSVMVWGCGALLGGIMTFVTSLGSPSTRAVPAADFPEAFALCFIAALLLTRLLRASGGKQSASLTVEAAGVCVRLEALCDTGCLAAEPITGMAVIPVRREALGGLAELCEREDCPLRLRLIPLTGIGGERLLRGFVPDRLTVNGKETEAVIAADSESRFAGYDALLPAVLCGRDRSGRRLRKNRKNMKKTEDTPCSSGHPC